MTGQVLTSATAVDLGTRRRDARARLGAARPSRRPELAHVEHQRIVDEISGLLSESEIARRGFVADQLQRPLIVVRRIDDALERLRAMPTLHELERAVPSELCWAGGFERVLYSRVENAMWSPVSWQTESGLGASAKERFREFVRGPEIQLLGGSVESEVIRRRTSALVSDADATSGGVAPVIGVVGSRSYVVAPVTVGDQVIALLHADTEGGRPLTESDRVAVQGFADGLGLVLERLSLQLQLNAQGARIKEVLETASAAVDEVAMAPMVIAGPVDAAGLVEASISSPRYAARLTEREREVFQLLVSGATNGQIADRLTVSETTVKSHVKHILRKLHVTNRAEAIAQFVKTRGGLA